MILKPYFYHTLKTKNWTSYEYIHNLAINMLSDSLVWTIVVVSSIVLFLLITVVWLIFSGSTSGIEGNACKTDLDCGDDLFCGGDNKCHSGSPVQEGGPCSNTSQCEIGLLCNSGSCQATFDPFNIFSCTGPTGGIGNPVPPCPSPGLSFPLSYLSIVNDLGQRLYLDIGTNGGETILSSDAYQLFSYDCVNMTMVCQDMRLGSLLIVGIRNETILIIPSSTRDRTGMRIIADLMGRITIINPATNISLNYMNDGTLEFSPGTAIQFDRIRT